MPGATAILLFRRQETLDQQIKRLPHRAIISLLNKKVQNLAGNGLFIHEVIDQPTAGCTIRERFCGILETWFAKGYDRLIIIGNDCPGLTTDLLHQAQDLLKKNDLIIGPDARGGAYLMGICRKAFSRKWALQLAWHTKDFRLSAENGMSSVASLAPRADINSQRDLKDYLDHSSASEHRWLLSALESSRPEISGPNSLHSLLHRASLVMRPPPPASVISTPAHSR